MAKAAITKKVNITANGILSIDKDRNFIGIENQETGEMIELTDLLYDFKDETVKLTMNYDEDLC